MKKWLIIIGIILIIAGIVLAISKIKGPGGKIEVVNLIGAWVDARAPEKDSFEFTGKDEKTYVATFNDDILPLFTKNDIWQKGTTACNACHSSISENSAHEMDMGSYKGIIVGADTISDPPGAKLFEPGKWDESVLRKRLRNNRMPPGWKFEMDESNRDGPCIEVSNSGVKLLKEGDDLKYGCDINAVGLIGAWVDAGAPEKDAFKYDNASLTFNRDILPFFTKNDMWFKGSVACNACHNAISEDSAHEMDMGSYKGIVAGADTISDPPGAKLFEPGKWDESVLRKRLRNNRMPPEMEFLMDESNRDGPIITAGQRELSFVRWVGIGIAALGIILIIIGLILRPARSQS